jgi:PKD repeat protein
MKKLFTLFSMLMVLGNTFAQTTTHTVSKQDFKKNFNYKQLGSAVHQRAFSGTRNATTAVMLDYVGADSYYTDQIGADFYYVPFLDINVKYGPTDNLTHDFAVAMFDTLIYIDANNNDVPAFLPRQKSTLHLDSLDIYFIYDRAQNSTSSDSIRFTIYNRNTVNVSGSAVTGTSIWDTLIATNAAIPLNVNNTFTGVTMYPNLQFLQGETFAVRVDFTGDTANKFNLIASFRDDCAEACVAEETSTNIPNGTPNALYYVNATSGTTNLSGVNSIQFNCGPPCNLWYPQNWWVFPWITADVQYGAAIVADSLRGCPNAQLNLSANAFGSNATPFTYSWATTSGNLTSTTDQQVSLVIGNSNATVTVTVTDANNQTTVATVTVQSRGVNVNITNANPLTIQCGASATLLSSISGFTTGKNYTWSTGTTGPNAATTQINQPGNYKVTVTNNAGCSASASIDVQYPGGLTNTISFTYQNPVCQNLLETFTNTSARRNGWTYLWTFGDNNTSFNENGTNTYAAPGVYPVKLTQDSAGCSFTSVTQNVTVLAASNAACLTGVEDVTFSNGVALLPNPTNGNVTINVNGVEKNLSIRIYNIIGSEVMTFSTTDVATIFNKTFDLSSFANGTYLVKIQSGEKTAVKRLTVAK